MLITWGALLYLLYLALDAFIKESVPRLKIHIRGVEFDINNGDVDLIESGKEKLKRYLLMMKILMMIGKLKFYLIILLVIWIMFIVGSSLSMSVPLLW